MFITNVLKSRPPGNRDPELAEIDACKPYLHKQVEPDRAARDLHAGQLRHQAAPAPARITGVHGRPQVHELGGRAVRVFPIYHPAAALRSTKTLEELREDFAPAARAAREPPPVPIGAVRRWRWRRRAGARAAADKPVRLTRESSSPQETEAAAGAGRAARAGRRGAGQRRARQRQDDLVRGACARSGVEGPVTSPTFTPACRGSPEVAHLDLYRLGRAAGEDPALLDDYLTPERVAFVEWPAVAEPSLERVAARAAGAPGRRPPADHDRVTLLGIDTSTSASAACVLRADGASFEVEPSPARWPDRPARARELMPAVAEVMERADRLRRPRRSRWAWGRARSRPASGSRPHARWRARAACCCGRSRRWRRWPRASTRAAPAADRRPPRRAVRRAARRRRRGGLAAVRRRPGAVAERVRGGLGVRAAGDGSIRFRGCSRRPDRRRCRRIALPRGAGPARLPAGAGGAGRAARSRPPRVSENTRRKLP